MEKVQQQEAYDSPWMETIEVRAEGGYSLSDSGYGGSNEDLGDFDDMEWGN